jgi:hypothetical protein
MTGAAFDKVPAFNQADFNQAPDLDDVEFPLPSFWRGRAEVIAQYRALRRLAIQGADYEREQMALKGEIRSKRGTKQQRSYHAGFWYGLFYDALSDFGRSAWRPFLAWSACIIIFAVYFLGQNIEMTMRRDHAYSGWLVGMSEYTRTAWKALWSSAYCYPGTPPAPGSTAIITDGFTGLVEEVRAETNLVNEALSIAYHNAVIILDGSGDSAHRAFGCLYGVER